MKKLLIYCWGSLNEPPLIEAVKSFTDNCICFKKQMKDYHADAKFATELIQTIHSEHIEAIFSYDYFPLIAMICEMNQIPYISWIYDCPQYTLYSQTLGSQWNWIFCFDRIFSERLVSLGAKHCIHYPLGYPNHLIYRKDDRWKHDTSFIGNFYDGEKNRIRHTSWDDYTKGFLDGIIDAQLKIYGYNFIYELLSEEMTDKVASKCDLSLGNQYYQDTKQLVVDAINMEVSCRERELVCSEIDKQWKLDIYTNSKLLQTKKLKNVNLHGFADYVKEVPLIYHNSKINLNITSRTIESGVPQRVFDILGCEGFCLTNYQPEIAELFEDGTDLVMYQSMEDMCDKIDYYLSNEIERQKIAQNGKRKIEEYYRLNQRLKSMFEYCGLF